MEDYIREILLAEARKHHALAEVAGDAVIARDHRAVAEILTHLAEGAAARPDAGREEAGTDGLFSGE